MFRKSLAQLVDGDPAYEEKFFVYGHSLGDYQ